MDSTVSNQHAIIRIDGSDALLFDNASTNGTFVGHEQVLTPRQLADGNEIRMGNTTVVVHL
jgi:pSer/pThr/pTyr-binding forkhead associated (FHA) protein